MNSAPSLRVEVLARLDVSEVAAVGNLVERATEADGVRPLSEHVTLHLRAGGDSADRHLLAWARGPDGPDLAGYAHLDTTDAVEGASAEIAVHPRYRRQGIGGLLLDHLVAESQDGRLRLWAHGEQAGAARLARARGFERSRTLWQMRRSLFAPLPRLVLPPGATLRAFRPGLDDEEWVRLNAESFADLPDQGRWTVDDLRLRMAEPWFDPQGFLVATTGGGGQGTAELIGFHWTKVHGGMADAAPEGTPADGTTHHDHEPIGEVYVVGVHPAWSGRGLGRALTIAGLQHLRGRGLPAAMLYVDSANTRALSVYESLGFTRWDTDVLFRRTLR